MTRQRGPRICLGLFLIYLVVIFSRAIRVHANGNVFATPLPVWGDWPVHFTMATSMAFRSLLLTSSPLVIYAPFHYPFLANFISALLVRTGAPFFACFWIPSLLMVLGGTVLLFALYRKVFNSENAAILGLTFFGLNGGFGFVWLLKAAKQSTTPLKMLLNPPALCPLAPPDTLIWDSVIRGIFLPQRSFQIGFLFGIAALYLLWTAINQATTHRTWRWWIGGVCAGFLPISNLHSFAAIGVISAVWMIWDIPRHFRRGFFYRWSLWARYGCTAVGLAALQFGFLSIVSFEKSVARYSPGWYVTTSVSKWAWFWIVNWGLTPFLAAWGYWRLSKKPSENLSQEQLFIFVAPFLILFTIMNLFILQPWIWDNTKILAWVSVAVSGLAGWAIVEIWGFSRTLAIALCFVSCLSGGIEAARLIHPLAEENQLYTHEEMDLVAWVKENTEANGAWLTADYHNNWVYNLAGRQVMMAYEGWLWSHGYSYADVKSDLYTLLKNPDREDLLTKYDIVYASVGPVEREQRGSDPQRFETTFTPILKTANYTLFRRKPPKSRASVSSVNP